MHQPRVADGVGYVPLHDRSGTVRAWAKLDPDMVAWAAQWQWHLSKNGEAVRNIGPRGNPRKLSLSRAVLGLPQGPHPRVIHIDHDPLNSRRSNLRISRRWLLDAVERDPELAHVLDVMLLRISGARVTPQSMRRPSRIDCPHEGTSEIDGNPAIAPFLSDAA